MSWDNTKFKKYDTSQGYGNSRKWKKAFKERMSDQEAIEILSGEDATPYEILEISVNATQSEIKAAFRRLIVIWHPDKNPHNIVNAEAMSKKIIAAYTLLYK